MRARDDLHKMEDPDLYRVQETLSYIEIQKTVSSKFI